MTHRCYASWRKRTAQSAPRYAMAFPQRAVRLSCLVFKLGPPVGQGCDV